MFQVIFIFSDWTLIKQIIISSTPLFLAHGRNWFSKICPWSVEWGTAAWVKMHRFNAISNVNTINWKKFSTDAGIYKSEKIQQAFRKEMEFKEKGCITVYQFGGSNLGFEIFLKKKECQEKGVLK